MTPNTNEGTTEPMKTISEDQRNIDRGTASDCMSQAIYAFSCTECGRDATFGHSGCAASAPLCMACAKNPGLSTQMTEELKHQCPECGGSGRLIAWDGHVLGECGMCRGFKTIPNHQLEWIAKGRALRERRISRRITLRDMAISAGVDVVDLSQIERGIIKPSSEIANYYADL